MKFVIAPGIVEKIAKRGIDLKDIIECFANRTAGNIVDDREHNRTNPPTVWFISETDNRRELKVVYIHLAKADRAVIKSAYPPDREEKVMYIRYAPPK